MAASRKRGSPILRRGSYRVVSSQFHATQRRFIEVTTVLRRRVALVVVWVLYPLRIARRAGRQETHEPLYCARTRTRTRTVAWRRLSANR
jgi:hypothetical protein